MTEHKLRRFVLNDGAKPLAVRVIAAAKDCNPETKANELHKQNDTSIQLKVDTFN